MQFFTSLGRFFAVQHRQFAAIILVCIVIHPIRCQLLKLGTVICRLIRSSSKKFEEQKFFLLGGQKKKEKNE